MKKFMLGSKNLMDYPRFRALARKCEREGLPFEDIFYELLAESLWHNVIFSPVWEECRRQYILKKKRSNK